MRVAPTGYRVNAAAQLTSRLKGTDELLTTGILIRKRSPSAETSQSTHAPVGNRNSGLGVATRNPLLVSIPTDITILSGAT